MLPENTFPVTGGIMQTEEVVPRAESTGIDGSLTDSTSFVNPLDRSPLLPCPLSSSSILMAVKQEPQEDDERARDTNILSRQAEVDAALLPVETGHLGHHDDHEGGSEDRIQDSEDARTGTSSQDNARARSGRRRRKSRWKLKFHHQALPPQYLDHYEATLAQEALNSSSQLSSETTIPSPVPIARTSASTTPSPLGDVQGWLHRIAAMQQELYSHVVSSNEPVAASSSSSSSSAAAAAAAAAAPPYRRSVITSALNSHSIGANQKSHQVNVHGNQQQINENAQMAQQQQQPTPRPPMKYSDLPYMGEITLDNSKPRRGRKPKKADICHLIYKNYGTILPGTPGHEERKQQQQQQQQNHHHHHHHHHNHHQQLQHHHHHQPDHHQNASRERSSDASLSQHQLSFQRTDIQNRISSLLEKRLTQESKKSTPSTAESSREQDEPLNLCIRDLNQLKIRISRKHGNVYESGNVKSEASSDTDEVECIGATYSGNPVDPTRSTELSSNASILNNNNNNNNNNEGSNNSGFVYWPNAGVLIHPMALQSQFLYYQKLATERGLSRLEASSREQRIVPKSIYAMLEGKSALPIGTCQRSAIVPSSISPSSPRPKRNAPISHQITPVKRKRSAIFIPPLPTENNNNPPTEVSICKFKFTGGAKPSLQEKKSLSVDSDGTFRYYTGTGDKSTRGYSVFPRESLQQPAGQAATSAGAFLSAAGERIAPPPPAQPPPPTPTLPLPSSTNLHCQKATTTALESNDVRRKRKTRKSLQREKLEQTFKEKGFLIQTQQLESAEGATYCKFRQLRKFTRYLFRSWKDYLPGDVCDLSVNVNGRLVDHDNVVPEAQRSIVDSTIPLDGIIELPGSAALDEHAAGLPLA